MLDFRTQSRERARPPRPFRDTLASMRTSVAVLSLGLFAPWAAHAQAPAACGPGALSQAARSVITLRHQMHTEAVGELDPNVPARIGTQLAELKSDLAQAADAAFACAAPSATPEELQDKLAAALHANLSTAAETAVIRGKNDVGAYGSDLSVQVFPLYNSPRFYEVDFRFGVECGDDNLLLVYRADPAGSARWQPVLRWGAPSYNTVGDAFGDFILLTPLSGFQGARNWRFVVAHGHPGCNGESAPSRFDLDLLEPTADPAAPTVAWHFSQSYRRSEVPRLSTTEDTLTFQLRSPDTAKGHTGQTTAAQTFRFHVTRDNKVEPMVNALANTPSGSAPPSDP
jgi:hypothetical protein